MQRAIFILLMGLGVMSCDPVSSMEAYIINSTPQDLSITFVSSDNLIAENATLQVGSNETVLFQENFDIGSTYTQPMMMHFDSIYIQNQDNEILKVFKPTSDGKNIYNVDEDWAVNELSKRVFRFEYEVVD